MGALISDFSLPHFDTLLEEVLAGGDQNLPYLMRKVRRKNMASAIHLRETAPTVLMLLILLLSYSAESFSQTHVK